MVEATNGVQQMAMMMLNPQFAAQQQKFALQQAMAQEMMKQGSEEPPTNQLANPGGMVVQNSPWAALSRAVEKGVGAYSAQKAIGDQLALATQMQQNKGPQDPNAPTDEEGLKALAYGDKLATAGYENRTAGSKKRSESQNTLQNYNGHLAYPPADIPAVQPAPIPAAAAAPTPQTPIAAENLPMPPTPGNAAPTNMDELLNQYSPPPQGSTPPVPAEKQATPIDWNDPAQAGVEKKFAEDTPANITQINATGEKAKNLQRMLDAADKIETGDIYQGNTSKIREDIGNTLSSLGMGDDVLKDTVSRTQAARSIYKQAMMDDKGLNTEGKTGGIQIRNQSEFNFVKEGYPQLEQLDSGRKVIKNVVRGELQRAINAQDVANEYLDKNHTLNAGYYKSVAQKNAQIPAVDVSGLNLPKAPGATSQIQKGATATGGNGHKIIYDGIRWNDAATGAPIK